MKETEIDEETPVQPLFNADYYNIQKRIIHSEPLKTVISSVPTSLDSKLSKISESHDRRKNS